MINIRARDKLSRNYLYIYSIYLVKDNSSNQLMWHFLCSEKFSTGLTIFFLDEIENIEVTNMLCDFVHPVLHRIAENDWSLPQTDSFKMFLNPTLEKILNEEWELYEKIVEGTEDSWLVFEEKLGYRP